MENIFSSVIQLDADIMVHFMFISVSPRNLS